MTEEKTPLRPEGGSPFAATRIRPVPNVVSVGVNKGGAGKSALSLFLALTAASMGARCAIVDMDPQCGLSFRVAGAAKMLNRGLVKSMLRGDAHSPSDEIVFGERISFIPGDLSGADHERAASNTDASANVLLWLSSLASGFDAVVVDSGPRPTRVEKTILSAGAVHCLPAGIDRASLVGVVCRMAEVVEFAGETERNRFVFVPWGINTSEKTGRAAALASAVSEAFAEFGLSVVSPFPPVPDMTDLLCGLDGNSFEGFLKYPGFVRRKKEFIALRDEFWNVVFSMLSPVGKGGA